MASDTDPLLDPDMALDRITAWQDGIREIATRTRTMSTRLTALRVTVSDPRHLVSLTIDSSGVLLDLRFGPRATRQEPDTLARAVLATLQDARRQALDRTRRIIVETIGPDSPAASEMLSRASDRLIRP